MTSPVAGKRNTSRQVGKVGTVAPAAPVRQPAKVATPVTRQPAKVVSAPARSSSGSGSGSGGGYGGSVGNSGGGGGGGVDYSGGGGDYSGGGGDFSAPAEPVQTEVTIPDPLGQESYKRAKAEILRARGDFDAQQNLARGQYDASFDDAQRQLGWRNAVPRVGLRKQLEGEGNDGPGFDPNAQGSSYGDAYQANQGDFAGRGLFNSGLYAQAVSNVNNQFADRRNSALRDQKDWRDTQALNQKNFYGQQDAADLAAQEGAIGEIMASLGVTRDQITPGRQNVIMR
jgi:hypothetical protein